MTSSTRPGTDLSDADFGDAETGSFAQQLSEGLSNPGELARGLDAEALAALGASSSPYAALIDDVLASTHTVGYKIKGVDAIADAGLDGTAQAAVSIAHTPTRHAVTFSAGTDVALRQIAEGKLDIGGRLARGGRVVTCRTPAGGNPPRVGEWACTAATARTPIYSSHFFLIPLLLVEEAPGAFEVTEYDTTIVGVPVRCLRAAARVEGEDDIEVCITGEGVPLRVEWAGTEYEGVWYKPSVDAGVFTPPAPVQAQ